MQTKAFLALFAALCVVSGCGDAQPQDDRSAFLALPNSKALYVNTDNNFQASASGKQYVSDAIMEAHGLCEANALQQHVNPKHCRLVAVNNGIPVTNTDASTIVGAPPQVSNGTSRHSAVQPDVIQRIAANPPPGVSVGPFGKDNADYLNDTRLHKALYRHAPSGLYFESIGTNEVEQAERLAAKRCLNAAAELHQDQNDCQLIAVDNDVLKTPLNVHVDPSRNGSLVQ